MAFKDLLVVKLFNAVNKAQHAQKGLNPSRSNDEKVIKKGNKEAFFSELSKPVTDAASKIVFAFGVAAAAFVAAFAACICSCKCKM